MIGSKPRHAFQRGLGSFLRTAFALTAVFSATSGWRANAAQSASNGASLYLSGDTSEAIAAFREAEKFGYRDIKMPLLLAEALDSTHATADAETEWRAALEIDPEYSDALDRLSNDLVADSDWNGVVELLDVPRLLPQRTVQQCQNLGVAYAKQGKLDESIRILRDGLNTYPDSLPLADQLADALTRSGKKDEADAVLQIARARRHGNADTQPH